MKSARRERERERGDKQNASELCRSRSAAGGEIRKKSSRQVTAEGISLELDFFPAPAPFLRERAHTSIDLQMTWPSP